MQTKTSTHFLHDLISTYPQHYAAWLLPDAQFKSLKPARQPETESEPDGLMRIVQHNQELLLSIWGLIQHDSAIEAQILEYNASINMYYDIFPLSYILCLCEDDNFTAINFAQKYVRGEAQKHDYCYIRKLWEVPTHEILQTNMAGLLPLLPLTKQGQKREVVDMMIEAMIMARQFDLLPLGETTARLVMHSTGDRIWLKRRFAMYQLH